MAATDQKEKLKLVLTEEEARKIIRQGEEAIIFKLLELSRFIKEKYPSSSTPSGMIPPYEKPPGKKSPKRPGRKAGHPGTRRGTPAKIDRRERHTLKRCPCCGGPLGKPVRKRKRIVEDIVKTEPEATEHEIPGYYCNHCKKMVEPVVPDALPKAAIGHRIVALTAWLHYGLGIPLSKVVEVLNHHLHFELTPGGLVQMWYRMQEILFEWYEEIGKEARDSSYLHGDESGWRVNGKTHWLWCFTNASLTFYMIEKCRGSPAVLKFLGEEFAGCLISDFWRAYDIVRSESRQFCLAHLLREIHDVDTRNGSPDWQNFSKRLKRLIRDGIRLSKKEGLSEKEFESKNRRLDSRLEDLVFKNGSEDPDVKRLSKRLAERIDGLFTFVDHPEVDYTNNRAEREIRPAVIIRKNSFGNRSDKGAQCQAVLMSIYRTLKLRGFDPVDTIVNAMRQFVQNGKIPPLPVSHG
jgi:transposase